MITPFILSMLLYAAPMETLKRPLEGDAAMAWPRIMEAVPLGGTAVLNDGGWMPPKK